MLLNILLPAADPGIALFYGLAAITAVLLFLLIVITEATAMQWIGWDRWNGCLKASLIMNLASVLPVILLFFIAIRWGLAGIALAWLVSVLVEGAILKVLKRGEPRPHWLAAFAANLSSYLIILLPAYLIGVPHV